MARQRFGGVEFRIRGRAVFSGDLDLSTSTVRFDALMAELGRGGQGELIKTVDDGELLPLTVFVRRKRK